MAKPKLVNPCQMKGRYLGRRSSGRKYSNSSAGIVIIPSGCECTSPFRNLCGTTDFITKITSYGLDKKSEKPQTDFQRITGKNQKLLLSVPCEKTFLHPDSEGTRAFLNLKGRQNEKSSFKGCYDIDDWLLKENLINYDIRESLGMYNDMLSALEEKTYQEEIRDLNWEVILSFFTEKGSRTELKERTFNPLVDKLDELDRKNDPSFETDSTPGYDDEPTEAKNKSDKDEDKQNRVVRAFKKMTRLQRKAVRAYFLQNWQDRTKIEVAKSLGISVDSLNDRLTLAYKKIQAEFLDFEFKKSKKELPKEDRIFKTKGEARALAPIKLIQANGLVQVFQVTKRTPRPFGALKERTGVNQEQIKKKIREFFAAKYGKI